MIYSEQLTTMGRRTGKTTAAIHWLVQDPKRILVVPSHQHLRNIQVLFGDHIFRAIRNSIFVANDVVDRTRGIEVSDVCIDDIEQISPELLKDIHMTTWIHCPARDILVITDEELKETEMA